MKIRAALVLIFFATTVNIAADDIRPAWLQITETTSSGVFDLVWKQPAEQNRNQKIEPVFPEACISINKTTFDRNEEWLIKRTRLSCGDETSADQMVRINGLEHALMSVFVRLVQVDGTVKSFIVKPSDPAFALHWGADDSDLFTYFQFGLEHLLAGYDHILFVIGLVLLVRLPIKLIQVVTSFTIAHSLTLALSTLGLVSISQNVVEAVIALSIVFLAFELVRAQDHNPSLLTQYPWAMTFFLGLLHGFGFASALTTIDLPQETIVPALLLFNIGVEIGQLMLVSVVLAGLFFSRFIPHSLLMKIRSLPAYLLGSIGSFWLIQRIVVIF